MEREVEEEERKKDTMGRERSMSIIFVGSSACGGVDVDVLSGAGWNHRMDEEMAHRNMQESHPY